MNCKVTDGNREQFEVLKNDRLSKSRVKLIGFVSNERVMSATQSVSYTHVALLLISDESMPLFIDDSMSMFSHFRCRCRFFAGFPSIVLPFRML